MVKRKYTNVWKMMWDKYSWRTMGVRKRTRCFPYTLAKQITVDKKSNKKMWINGYKYYPVDIKARQRLTRVRLSKKRHLSLPQPETQKKGADHCLHHALINATESRVRIKMWKLNFTTDTPRLSIQHAVDATQPFRNPDSVYHFMGIQGYGNLRRKKLKEEEKGVTTASNWPYRGNNEVDPAPKLPAADKVDWERFKLNRLYKLDEKEIEEFATNPEQLSTPIPNIEPMERYSLDSITRIHRAYNPRREAEFESLINSLIRNLIAQGSFVAWFPVRDTHTDSREIFTKNGRKKGDLKHTVAVSGWKSWRDEDGRFCGFWEYLDNYGKQSGIKGFGRIMFDAVEGVEIPIPNVPN